MAGSTLPDRLLAERVAHCLGQSLIKWRSVAGGYTVAARWLVTCADGSSAFIKGATDTLTATWLRQEYTVYSHVQAPFLPTMLAWDDDGEYPLLVLEDLSGAVWQAPWTTARITQVLNTLQQVAATPPPVALASLETRRPMLSGWAHVAPDPAAFLGLHLCSAAWLTHAIDLLVAVEAKAQFAGEELVHFDVRSDNLCFVEDRVVLIDWNWACRGNGRVDIAAWLPSLHLEGGPLSRDHSARRVLPRRSDQRLLCCPSGTASRECAGGTDTRLAVCPTACGLVLGGTGTRSPYARWRGKPKQRLTNKD